ncbi:hypothetical protein FNF29_08227 [Cafeteria roenbergensis]|uniref:FAM13A-like domain-containing protein n=3 Tax=Cafeteria roenbergensis TaxID=33653 RepID=A0A5A8BZL9_CAFRO|nr:hypothetical protein FNF29_08227 [Cafeteria roenbergensis]|mmetsp:Transcript_17638/g.66622  ORF Transcript_17638/g.66622 Transcript_17638/m.66622 type:complete len:326 (+) Transcript_17638:218-1195(+)|eukprot:KAA0146166.1 hypothetical protein FNF29_08227 [Cafeteria roenbergensis]
MAFEGPIDDLVRACVGGLFGPPGQSSPRTPRFSSDTVFSPVGGEHAWTVRCQPAKGRVIPPSGDGTDGEADGSDGNLSDDDNSGAAAESRTAGPPAPRQVDTDDNFGLTVSPANASIPVRDGPGHASVPLQSSEPPRRDPRPGLSMSLAHETPLSVAEVHDSARQVKAEGLLGALRAEKSRLKRHLRALDDEFESTHGRRPTRSEKEHLRPQYERYRSLKRRIAQCAAGDSAPSEGSAAAAEAMEPGTHARGSGDAADSPEKNLATLRAQKRQLQIKLRHFEEDFRRSHGRAVQFHRDIRPVEHDYRRYKDLKRSIAKLEAAAKE